MDDKGSATGTDSGTTTDDTRRGGQGRREVLKTPALTVIGATAGLGIAQQSAPAPETSRAPAFTNGRDEFDLEAGQIYERHWRQTRQTVEALKKKYESRSAVGCESGTWSRI